MNKTYLIRSYFVKQTSILSTFLNLKLSEMQHEFRLQKGTKVNALLKAVSCGPTFFFDEGNFKKFHALNMHLICVII